jgi:hypothetical protein
MRSVSRIPSKTGGKVRLDDGKFGKFSVRLDFGTSLHSSQTCPRRSGLANNHEQTQSCLQSAFIWRMSVKAVEEASQDFAVDVAALRDDVEKQSSSLSEFICTQTTTMGA